jgi:hypothetical protein
VVVVWGGGPFSPLEFEKCVLDDFWCFGSPFAVIKHRAAVYTSTRNKSGCRPCIEQPHYQICYDLKPCSQKNYFRNENCLGCVVWEEPKYLIL